MHLKIRNYFLLKSNIKTMEIPLERSDFKFNLKFFSLFRKTIAFLYLFVEKNQPKTTKKSFSYLRI